MDNRAKKLTDDGLRRNLAAAATAMLGADACIAQGTPADDEWNVDMAFLYYGEKDRISDFSLRSIMQRALGEENSISIVASIDALTGASPNGAVPALESQTFTRASDSQSFATPAGEIPLADGFKDTRGALDVTWLTQLNSDTRLNVGASVSVENDYIHAGINGSLAWDLFDGNSTLQGGISLGHDIVDPIGGAPTPLSRVTPPDQTKSRLAAATPTDWLGLGTKDGDEDEENEGGGRSESKDIAGMLLGWTQIVDRNSVLQLNYSLSYENGYLVDPYKLLTELDTVNGAPISDCGDTFCYRWESRPDSRARQALFAEYKRYVFDRDVLNVSFRYGFDDWGIDSSTLEARYRFNFDHNGYLEPHFRFYNQSAADFYQPYLAAGQSLPEFASADYRLADFDAYTLGVEYGRKSRDGNNWSVRLEYYAQRGNTPAEFMVGDLALFESIYPDLDAVYLQFGYAFDW